MGKYDQISCLPWLLVTFRTKAPQGLFNLSYETLGLPYSLTFPPTPLLFRHPRLAPALCHCL